jgi:hypothetical protein
VLSAADVCSLRAGDGAGDLIYASEGGFAQVVLSKLEDRDDNSKLDKLVSSDTIPPQLPHSDTLQAEEHRLVHHLAAEMNPENINAAATECDTMNPKGAWCATREKMNEEHNGVAGKADGVIVTTWGLGSILTAPNSDRHHLDDTIVDSISGPLDATDPSVSNHAPQCPVHGSQVREVTTQFYIDFPIVPCVEPGPHCILLDPLVSCARTRETRRLPV